MTSNKHDIVACHHPPSACGMCLCVALCDVCVAVCDGGMLPPDRCVRLCVFVHVWLHVCCVGCTRRAQSSGTLVRVAAVTPRVRRSYRQMMRGHSPDHWGRRGAVRLLRAAMMMTARRGGRRRRAGLCACLCAWWGAAMVVAVAIARCWPVPLLLSWTSPTPSPTALVPAGATAGAEAVATAARENGSSQARLLT